MAPNTFIYIYSACLMGGGGGGEGGNLTSLPPFKHLVHTYTSIIVYTTALYIYLFA